MMQVPDIYLVWLRKGLKKNLAKLGLNGLRPEYCATFFQQHKASSTLASVSFWFVFSLALASCGADKTTGHRLRFETHIKSDSMSFVTDKGWNVELHQLWVSGGPIYYYNSDPAFPFDALSYKVEKKNFLTNRLSFITKLLRPVGATFSVPSVWAHPGHDQKGALMGEMKTPYVVLLNEGESKLASSEGISGDYLSAEYQFQTPSKMELYLKQNVLFIEGRATKEKEERLFRMTALAEDVLDEKKEPSIRGCIFKHGAKLSQDGVITITLFPVVWFSGVDFLEFSESASYTEIEKTNRASRIFFRNLKGASAILFSY